MLNEYRLKTFEAAVDAMVLLIGSLLRRQVSVSGRAVFAVGGGRTPRYVLPKLAIQDCPWADVTVMLTDDRKVPADNPDSNEGLVRKYLFRERAQKAKFYGLIERPKNQQVIRIDIAYLGFGEDGHVASLFPGGPELIATHQGTVETLAPERPKKRISLTLPTICAARHLILLVTGEKKYRVYQRARRINETRDLPLALVLSKTRGPVSAFIVEG